MSDLEKKQIDNYFKIAYGLALKAKRICRPNPAVGALVVYKNKIIGKGYTQEYGRDHAEVVAIRQAFQKKMSNKERKKTILFVTLTPCNIYGKTPPCCDLIVKNKIGRVFIANQDPNLKEQSAEKLLQKSKIKVDYNCPEKINQKLFFLNKDFFYRVLFNLPWIHMKYAMTLDGKMATKNFDSKWITDEKARKSVQKERAIYDAIMIGQRTFFYDNPSLIPKVRKVKNPFLLCILTKDFSQTQIQKIKNHQLLKNSVKTFFIVKKEFKNFISTVKEEQLLFYQNCWADKKFLRYLVKKININSIYFEGGSFSHGVAIQKGIVNSFSVYIAPKFLADGCNALSPISHKNNFIAKMSQAKETMVTKISKIDQQILVEGVIEEKKYREVYNKVFLKKKIKLT